MDEKNKTEIESEKTTEESSVETDIVRSFEKLCEDVLRQAKIASDWFVSNIDQDTEEFGKQLEDEKLSEEAKDKIVKELIRKLENSKNPKVRFTSLEYLYDKNEAYSLIYRVMNEDEDENVRRRAWQMLKGCSSREGYRNIEEFIRSVLPEIRRTQTINENIVQLRSRKAQLRKEAIWQLGDMGATEAIPLLGKIIRLDKNIRVRAWAVLSLGQIGGDVLFSLKQVLIGNDKELVKYSAAIALRELDQSIGKVDEDILRKVQEDLLNERTEVIISPPKKSWWQRQKPIIKDLIKGALGALLGALIGGFVGWLL